MKEGDHTLKTWKQGIYTVEEFPKGYLLLNEELAKYSERHPKLMALLEGQPMDDLDVKLAIIAHYCGVALDGEYTLESRSELCSILAGRLEILREIISQVPIQLQ